MTHAPEIGTENLYQKTGSGFLQVCHANRYRYFPVPKSGTELVQETVTKMTSTDWSDDHQLCCLFIHYTSCVVCCFIALK